MNGEPAINWVGLFVLALLSSAVETFIVALFLRRLYRESVIDHMRGEGTPRPSKQSDDGLPPAAYVELREYYSLPALSPEAEELYSLTTRTPRRAAVVFASAGVAHAIVATAVMFLLTGTDFSTERTPAVLLAMSWPVLPTVVVVAITDRWKQFLWPGLFVVAILLLSGPYRTAVAIILLTQMLAPTAVMFAVANWWMRSIGPVVMVFTSVFIFGLMVSPFAAYRAAHNMLGLDSPPLIYALSLFFMQMFIAAAFGFVFMLGRRYRKKSQSSQMMLLSIYWLLVTGWQCLLLAPKAGAGAAAGLLAYVAYRLVLSVGLRLFRRTTAGACDNVRLLFLRVFGSPALPERTLEVLSLHWRYAGSIQLIEGEDLAVANLEPDELIDFVTLQLPEHFARDSVELVDKLSRINYEPDPDRRFRVNESFCDDAVWREALPRLVDQNDVVLMDLRGFDTDNEGVVFELSRLINKKSLRETVMLIDSTTNKDFLRHVLSKAWEKISDDSPNPRTPSEPVYLLRIREQNSHEARRLLHVLCAAASEARTAQCLRQKKPPGASSNAGR
jgi:hypothetical protein